MTTVRAVLDQRNSRSERLKRKTSKNTVRTRRIAKIMMKEMKYRYKSLKMRQKLKIAIIWGI